MHAFLLSFCAKLVVSESSFSLAGMHKVVYKSHSLCAIFQLFGTASIQVWLLLELLTCNVL